MKYSKPKTYRNQATVEGIEAGIPYYIASPTYGYIEGVVTPVAGTVSTHPEIDRNTGEIKDRESMHNSLWVTTTSHRRQRPNEPFHRASLSDDGVVYQTYSDRLAFTNIISALFYVRTGKTQPV